MKKGNLLYRSIYKLPLPAFSAAIGGTLACGVAVATICAGLGYNFLTHGKSIAEFDWGLAGTASVVALLSATGLGFLTGRIVTASIEGLTQEMEAAFADKARAPSMLASIELRNFRARALRRVSQLRRKNQKLKTTAYIDSRTGLGNSTALEREIDSTVLKTSFESPGALLLLDLDGFTRIIEHHGTVIGQQLLRLAGARMERELKSVTGLAKEGLTGSRLFSLENDTYAVWMPDARGRENVAAIARALRMAFVAPFEVEGHLLSIGVSGGIALAPEEGDSRAKLMLNADLAVRQVRKEKATGFRFFTPRLTRLARGRYQLEAELKQAVENREFRPVFQPKIDFATGRVVSAEALARWRRPNGKIISPGTFIPLAEETGLIDKIGEQILEASCLSARAWLREGHDVSIAVNVSPQQFQTGDLTQTVRAILSRTNLPPSRLELEITESMAVANPDHVAKVMNPLRDLGMKLAIDDFGTGHSNLAMLTQLPFDVFKIDRQFVSALDRDQNAPAIVEVILALAETLGLQTVAEGIETPQQAQFLRNRNCTIAQGFLYSPGLTHEAFMDFLRTWQVNPVPVPQRQSRQFG